MFIVDLWFLNLCLNCVIGFLERSLLPWFIEPKFSLPKLFIVVLNLCVANRG